MSLAPRLRLTVAAAVPGPVLAACGGAKPTGAALIGFAVASHGNLYSGTSGSAPVDRNAGSVFVPPYASASVLTPASAIEGAVRSGAGPH